MKFTNTLNKYTSEEETDLWNELLDILFEAFETYGTETANIK